MMFDYSISDSECKTIVYSKGEEFFNSTPINNADIFFLINYVNLEFDSVDRGIKNVWGWSPMASWRKARLELPEAISGDLLVKEDYDYKQGISYRLDRDKEWKAYFDADKGIFCMGNKNPSKQSHHIKVGNNTIFSLSKDNNLETVWIKMEWVVNL